MGRIKDNIIIIYDNYAEMVVESKGNIYKALIDKEDIKRVDKYKWWLSCNGYLMTDTYDGDYKNRYTIHRYILNVDDREILVDHINRNRLDNRKCNLRKTTPTGNSINRSVQSNNKSGIIGVSWSRKLNKWEVRIKLHGKKKFIGYTKDLEEATRMRLQAELDIFGEEYAPQRHLFDKYNIHTRNSEKYDLKYEDEFNEQIK